MKRTISSLVIGLPGVTIFTVALLHVMKIGTCASGGPYVSARACPAGTGGWILLLTLGILLAVVGMIVGSFGGGSGLLVWCALFLGSGVAMLVNSLTGHDLSGGAKTAGYTVGGIFIPMGGIPLVWLIVNWVRGAGERRLKARSKEADATVSRVEELERFGMNQAKIRVSYSVQPRDDASFEVSRTTNALLNHLPRVGQRVKVRYDPSDRNRFEVVTATAAETAAALGATAPGGVPFGALASLAAVTRAAASGGAAPGIVGIGGAGLGAAPSRDPLDRLKELTELRDAGALTPAEFEAQKAKILAET
jgi:hypothetical protein